MLDVIKSYLVSLGFDIDKSSYDDTQKKLGSFENKLTAFGSDAVKTFGKAATAITAFGIAAAVGIAKFLNGLGNQQIEMEMLSRQLWTTQQQANAFNATMKAMGANLQDLYLSPTLMQQYQKLHAFALEMQTPADYNAQIQQVQSIQLQIKQLRLEAYYALQWIGYYFIKYMSGPISKVHAVLQSINAVIVKNMPTWTKKVAEVMASFVQGGIYIVGALDNVWNWLKKLAGYIPTWAKVMAGAFALISISNPFMLFVEGISAVLLLLDDFETYIHGGKSALGPFWSWLMKVVDALKQMGIGKDIANKVQSAFEWLGKTLKNVGDFTVHLFETFQKNGTLKEFVGLLQSAWKVDGNLIDAIGSLIAGLLHLFGYKEDMTGFFQALVDAAMNAGKLILSLSDEMGILVKLVGDSMQGKWGKAWGDVKNFFNGKALGDAGFKPSDFGKQSFTQGGKSPVYGPPIPQNGSAWDRFVQGVTLGAVNPKGSYIYGPPMPSTHKNVNMTVNQNNYISGSSPQGTANAVQQTFNRNIHNIRGAIG